jgi:hypothetical protein
MTRALAAKARAARKHRTKQREDFMRIKARNRSF